MHVKKSGVIFFIKKVSTALKIFERWKITEDVRIYISMGKVKSSDVFYQAKTINKRQTTVKQMNC